MRGRPAAAEWLALAAALGVFGYLAWDGALWDARFQLLLHLIGVGAIGAVVVLALRGAELPRTRIDPPVLGLIAAFGLATVSALNVGMSLRAVAVIVAYAAMLPVAILAVRHRPSWVGWVTSAPILLLAIPTLSGLVARRLAWITVGAPGLPPLRLVAESTPFGSVAVPPFVLVPAWVLAGLIRPAGARRAVRVAIGVVGAPLVILSGSRSAWLALGAMAVMAGIPVAWRQRNRLRVPSRITPRSAGIGLGAAAAVVVIAVLVLPRMTAITSVVYRAGLWADTLSAWSSDPLLGIGPGFMPYARLAAAADFTFPVRQPHSHNLLLGVLGDAGMVGVLAATILIGTLILVAGPWRCRSELGRSASIVLIGLGIGGLFEDLTFLPGFSLVAIALVAVVLLDSGAVEWVRIGARPPRFRALVGAGAAAGAVVLATAMIVADAGAITYRAAIDAAADARWDEAADGLARSVAIDPWHPAGPRALTVAADAAGQPTLGRRAAEQATFLNPGDATSWVNLALLCTREEDRVCAADAASAAVASAPNTSIELLNAAVVLAAADETDAADHAYRLSLLTQPLTSFMVEWPRHVPIGDGRTAESGQPAWELNVLLARADVDEPIAPSAFADPAVRAFAHALRGERTEAEAMLAAAIERQPGDPRTWELAIVLRDAWGLPTDHERAVAAVVRGSEFPPRQVEPRVSGLVFDIASFRAYPRDGFVSDATRRFTDPSYPWILGELLP